MLLKGIGNPSISKITDGVYAIIDLYHPAEGAGTNAGFIIDQGNVVVIDSGMSVASGQFIWSQILKINDKIDHVTLILTHHHSDHVFGMRVFKEKGAKIIAHQKIVEPLKIGGRGYKEFIVKQCQITEEQGDEIFGDVRFFEPDKLIQNDLRLRIGDMILVVLATPGHVADELCVYHAQSKTLFAGDTIYEGMPLTTRFGGINEWKEWIDQLDRLKQLIIDTICPGHGKLCSKEIIDVNINFLKQKCDGL